jgi:hypothetical protein
VQAWEYRVAYVDFRGRVSIEGEELVMERGDRRSAFVRSVLDRLGRDGWELAGVHPLWPAETSYMIFKRPAGAEAGTPTTGDAEVGEPTRDLNAGTTDL